MSTPTAATREQTIDEQCTDLERRFGYHKPPASADGAALAEMRAELCAMAKHVVRSTPRGREQALAITKLEEAMFWANAAVARTWPLVTG